MLINSFTCLHSISPGIGTAIQLSCTRLTRQSDADSCALSLGDGVVTFLWGSKLMVATPVRIIQYLWKMLGYSGEGIQRPTPPPPPPPPTHTHTSVARVRESGRRHQMWAPERFFSGYLSLPIQSNPIFQSDVGRYRQGDSVDMLPSNLFIYLFFILHNRIFGRLSGIKSHRKKYILMIGRVVSVWKCFTMDKIKQESSNLYKALISFAELYP